LVQSIPIDWTEMYCSHQYLSIDHAEICFSNQYLSIDTMYWSRQYLSIGPKNWNVLVSTIPIDWSTEMYWSWQYLSIGQKKGIGLDNTYRLVQKIATPTLTPITLKSVVSSIPIDWSKKICPVNTYRLIQKKICQLVNTYRLIKKKFSTAHSNAHKPPKTVFDARIKMLTKTQKKICHAYSNAHNA